ncbi:hypothetical protein A2U01_0074293, partial [Trifolium medium]|nr:hypothetical protein [Trifolium medium]
TDTINKDNDTSDTVTVANMDILGVPSTIPQESTVQSDLDELYTALEIDPSCEILLVNVVFVMFVVRSMQLF